MKFFKCGKCDKILEKKYAINHPASEITWYDADEHEERIKKVEEIEENSNEEDKKKKVNDIDTLKAKLHDLEERMKDVDDDELTDLLESLLGQMDELEKLKPDEKDKDRDTKQASVEFIGVDTYHSVRKDGDDTINELQTLQLHRKKKSKNSVRSYSVLALNPYEKETHSGDRLLMRMGSTDSDSVSDTSGDELLRKLGSTD